MAAALTKAIGQEVRYNDVPPEAYRSFGFPGADDLGNMFQFKRRFGSNATLAIAAKRHRGGFRSTVERPRWPEMLEAWLAPDHRYFKFRGDDGVCYILRNDALTGRWELTMFDRTGTIR